MLTRSHEKALNLLLQIFEDNNIFYIAFGGLAAIAWGSKRKLVDIDVAIPRAEYSETISLVNDFVEQKTHTYKNENWDIEQRTVLKINGVTIDICQIENLYVLDNSLRKQAVFKNITVVNKKVNDIYLSVIQKHQLIEYKLALNRAVDKEDVSFIK